MNDFLRKQVKELKAYQDIRYIELAEYLEIKPNSFYNWLRGQYDLSFDRQQRLKQIIEDLKEC